MLEDWDFYLCHVDDSPASVFLNLALHDYAPTAPERTLYAVRIEMRHPGAHGLGASEEAEVLGPIEDEIIRESTASGFLYVGRLRHRGHWQLTYMAGSGRERELEQIVKKHLKPDLRSFEMVQKDDAKWSYYREFLYPDLDRRQWIQNRRVVEALAEHGDPLTSARPVEHFVYFEDDASRARFSSDVISRGFAVEPLERDERGKYGVRLERVDSVELSHIHDVTMELTDLATRHAGAYDGWGTNVERSEN